MSACPRAPRWLLAGAGLLPALVLLAGCPSSDVVRIVDGVEVRGRYVSVAGYARYASGAEAEARGDDVKALQGYLLAARIDDESAELWVRIGSAHCRLRAPEQADEAFVRAEQLAPRYGPLWHERAACALARDEPVEALAHARRAAALAPRGEPTVLLLAGLLERSGDVAGAGRWLRELALSRPGSERAWAALAQHAERQRDAGWSQEADARLRALRRRQLVTVPDTIAWEPIDTALRAGARDEALREATAQRLGLRMLAPRALSLGAPELALSLAELVLGADPGDVEARIALALAADLTGRPQQVAEALRLEGPTEPLTPIARLMMAELLRRHVGAAAAHHWLGALAPPEDRRRGAADVAAQLQARLQASAADGAGTP